MPTANSRPEKESFLLVLFRHGDPDDGYIQERYTDYDQDFSGFSSVPGMEVELPENNGHFSEAELRIILPADTFGVRATSGVPHSPIFVQVVEVTQGLFTGDQNSQRTVFNGRVVRGRANYQGRNNVVALFSTPRKSRLDISMSFPCNHHCAWTLFGNGCGLLKSSFVEVGVIDSADGQQITVTETAVTNKTGTYWRRGYVRRGGLSIMIRDWSDADPTKMQLARRVPDDWILTPPSGIEFVPGCDKLVETCRSRYANEENFMGIGYSIPAYNPIISSPS